MAVRKADDAADEPEPEAGRDALEEDHAGAGRVAGPTLPLPLTARGEATRRRILDAAEEVFGAVGYYEASISEITRRAGVAQGTFYIYFHTKRDAFVELIDDIGNRLRAATTSAIAGAASRIEAERRGFAAFLDFVAAHRDIYRIVEEAGRVAPQAAREYYRRISQGYERGLRAAMASGEIRPNDPEALATALMGIGHFVALRWLVWPAALGTADQTGAAGESDDSSAPEVPDAVFAAVMDFIAYGLGAPDATA